MKKVVPSPWAKGSARCWNVEAEMSKIESEAGELWEHLVSQKASLQRREGDCSGWSIEARRFPHRREFSGPVARADKADSTRAHS